MLNGLHGQYSDGAVGWETNFEMIEVSLSTGIVGEWSEGRSIWHDPIKGDIHDEFNIIRFPIRFIQRLGGLRDREPAVEPQRCKAAGQGAESGGNHGRGSYEGSWLRKVTDGKGNIVTSVERVRSICSRYKGKEGDG